LIIKDLHRTLPDENTSLFDQDPSSGENQLFNVLKAFANYDMEISYCQGLNYLAAMLIIHIKEEETAFWCLVYLMEKLKWRGIYTENTPKLIDILGIVEMRLANDFPHILRHLEQNDLSIAATFSPVFITLFIY